MEWVDHYAGRGAHDVINDRTRREYRWLLIAYALAYFDPDERLPDIDEHRARGFVDWLCRLTDEDGHRLCDRSVRNAVLPLQSCLRHAARAGLLGDRSEPVMLLPRRRRGRAYEFDERRFLTREQLARLLAEIPDQWRPFFELLASTGLRISEASPCGSWTPTWARTSRGSTCAARSSTASSPAPSRAMAGAGFRSRARRPARGARRRPW